MELNSILSSLQQQLKDRGLLTEERKSAFDQMSQTVKAAEGNEHGLKNMVAALHQKGIAGTGGLVGQLAKMVRTDGRNITLEPGDFMKSLGGENKPVSISAPLAYDLWYLHNHVNLFKWVNPEESPDAYIDERLAFIKEKLASGGNVIKPLRGLLNPGQLSVPTGIKLGKASAVKNESEYFVQLMAFEIRTKGQSIRWDTDRTQNKEVKKNVTVNGENYPMAATVQERLPLEGFVGYLTFPVGQLGVMEQIAFFQESWSDEPKDNDQYRPTSLEAVFNPNPTELFPPKESFMTHCYGDYLIDDGYVRSPDNCYGQQIEIGCRGIPDKDYGGKDVSPKGWMRLWILPEDVFPVPGEFMGILCKPYPAPAHCWWFQESNPFLYAGNWIDAENLTSGIVESITLEEDRTDNGIGDEYTIRYHGIVITVYASDFYQYTVGERVAVLKVRSTEKKIDAAFSFVDQKQYGEPANGSKSEDYVIIPITYYKEEGEE
jgi:hypothetical protein